MPEKTPTKPKGLKFADIKELLKIFRDLQLIETSAGTCSGQVLRLATEECTVDVAQKSLCHLAMRLSGFKLEHPGVIVLAVEDRPQKPVAKPKKP